MLRSLRGDRSIFYSLLLCYVFPNNSPSDSILLCWTGIKGAFMFLKQAATELIRMVNSGVLTLEAIPTYTFN